MSHSLSGALAGRQELSNGLSGFAREANVDRMTVRSRLGK